MSRGQRARTPANFPRMRYRARARHARASVPAGLFWWTRRTGTQPIPDRGPFAGCTRYEAVALQVMARTLHAAGVPGVEHLAHHPLPGDEDTEPTAIRGLSTVDGYVDEGVLGPVPGAPWRWHNPFLPPEIPFKDPEREMERATGVPPRSLADRITAFDRMYRAVFDTPQF